MPSWACRVRYPGVRSSSTPNQDPRPLIAGATAHITGPRAKTAADILVEEGLYFPSCVINNLCYVSTHSHTAARLAYQVSLGRIAKRHCKLLTCFCL